MGGNARVINHDNGEVTAFAEQINLYEIRRSDLVSDLLSMLKILNGVFVTDYKIQIWDFDLLDSGEAFNGSSESFVNPTISDEDFIKHKQFIGDIDITIPHELLNSVFDFLANSIGNKFGKFVYLGQCKAKFYGHQINSVWDYNGHNIQIDFEGTEYKNKKPTEFAKFAHSASWADIEQGYKGVHHKYLLINLVRAISENDNIIILTPKSLITEEKAKKKVIHEPPRTFAFSIDRGLRSKYQNVDLILEGKQCVKELTTADSDYNTDIEKISRILFNEYDERFWSFTGLLNMISNKKEKNTIIKMYQHIYKQLWGTGAQALFRNDPVQDHLVKEKMISALIKEFPYLVDIDTILITELKEEFYNKYKTVELSD